MAASTQNDAFTNTYLYNQLDSYDWANDPEFQGGLSAILGSTQDEAQIAHLTMRAKCYYYARKTGTQVDFDGYKRWIESGRSEQPTNGDAHAIPTQLPEIIPASENADGGGGIGGMANAPKPASFADICEMIAEGKPIPGIKEIPDTILEGQKSEMRSEKRRKPWEKEVGGQGNETGKAGKLSWM